MPKTDTTPLAAARRSLAQPPDFKAFLNKVGAKARTTLEKHAATCDADDRESHGRLWRRLASLLGELAPLEVRTVGQQAIQYFVADGKYRMQGFALEDLCDGKLAIYAPDVLKQALRLGVLGRPTTTEDGGQEYAIGSGNGAAPAGKRPAAKGKTKEAASGGAGLRVDELDAQNTSEAPPHWKHMIGWNRKALRITLPTGASDAQIATTELLCALAAQQWSGAGRAAANVTVPA
jgi:hypothetical protein